MKIAFFNSYYYPDVGGGAEVTLKVLTQALLHAGHEVMVFCLGREKDVHVDIIDGVQVVRAGLDGMYFPLDRDELAKSALDKFLWHLRDQDNEAVIQAFAPALMNFKPDVASCHNLAGLSVSVWRHLKSLNIPIVQVLHDQYLLCPRTAMTKGDVVCEKQCLDCGFLRRNHASKSRAVNAVVGVSKYIVDKLVNAGYFSDAQEKIVINNVRDPSFWLQNNRSEDENEHKKITYGYIGGITPIKGVELLLSSFVASDFPYETTLRIAGNGDAAYVKKLQSRYADKRIVWVGYSKPTDFYNSIDILIVPSIWHDTLPGVVFEAFGYGIPVVGSKRGGIPEMVRHGTNGLLFEPAEPSSLAEAMRKICNPELIKRLSTGAQKSSEAFKDVPAWVQSYEAVYRRASTSIIST
jgi:glycosyltransferase involved in cell wall biosynthesis